MRILIEEYLYNLENLDLRNDLKIILQELGTFEEFDGTIKINYVGYYYSTSLKDYVFILPKVLLSIHNTQELVFEQYRPEDIVHIDNSNNPLNKNQKNFITNFAIWIYRAISVYRNRHDTKIIFQKNLTHVGRGKLLQKNNLLDILLSLIKFNRDNQNFFFFILKNQHSGHNKINWTKTITKSKTIIQERNNVQEVVYYDPINRKRVINFDEELIVIFYSILNYINDKYGFKSEINLNIPLIPKKVFDNYLRGMGKTRLRQIKYKYFSDKAIQLWNLCYAFFDQEFKVRSSSKIEEYLLVKDFNIVFEGIIDHLIGDELPLKYKEMKEQPDGKLVDHMYNWYNLTTRDKDESNKIFYIGDSKYYKRNTKISKEAWYKQFTYARNVIQWNLDLFLNGLNDENDMPIRDEVTEGYDINPNFFISAILDENLSYQTDIYKTEKKDKFKFTRQFENRLFDRDTLLVSHYDVNFLYVLSLYARENKLQQKNWRIKVRDLFRKEIQEMLEEHYDFYAIKAHSNINANVYFQEHFQELLGKIFTPYKNKGKERFFICALSNNQKFKEENEALITQLGLSFHIRKCRLGDNPREILGDIEDQSEKNIFNTQFLTLHYLEKYPNRSILIGAYKDLNHLKWILGNNDKGQAIYITNINSEVPSKTDGTNLKYKVKFVLLYDKENENNYIVYSIHHLFSMDNEQFLKFTYPSDLDDEFFIGYVLEERVSIGKIDLKQLFIDNNLPEKTDNFFITSSNLIKYRKDLL